MPLPSGSYALLNLYGGAGGGGAEEVLVQGAGELLQLDGRGGHRGAEQPLGQHVHVVAHGYQTVGAGFVGAEQQLVPGDALRPFHLAAEQERALVGEIGHDSVHLGGNARTHDGVGGEGAPVFDDAPALEGAGGRGHHGGRVSLQGR